MAIQTIVQGQALIDNNNLDLTNVIANYGAFDSLEIELNKINDVNALKWKYPDTDGYNKINVVDNKYYFDFTSAQTINLLGIYKLEFSCIYSENSIVKKVLSNFLEVIKEGK